MGKPPLKKYTASWVVYNGDGTLNGQTVKKSVMACSREHAFAKLRADSIVGMSFLQAFYDELERGQFDHTSLMWLEDNPPTKPPPEPPK